jgi:drug/metabolite transporter (DMT)-like permease
VVLFQQSAFLIGGEGTSILSTLEPITSVIIGVVIFHEPFGIRLLIGTILVILASVITVFFSLLKRDKKA